MPPPKAPACSPSDWDTKCWPRCCTKLGWRGAILDFPPQLSEKRLHRRKGKGAGLPTSHFPAEYLALAALHRLYLIKRRRSRKRPDSPIVEIGHETLGGFTPPLAEQYHCQGQPRAAAQGRGAEGLLLGPGVCEHGQGAEDRTGQAEEGTEGAECGLAGNLRGAVHAIQEEVSGPSEVIVFHPTPPALFGPGR